MTSCHRLTLGDPDSLPTPECPWIWVLFDSERCGGTEDLADSVKGPGRVSALDLSVAMGPDSDAPDAREAGRLIKDHVESAKACGALQFLKQTCLHQLYRDDYIPLVILTRPENDPPVGQVRLVEPTRLSADSPLSATWLREELAKRRTEMELALMTEDWLVLSAQAEEFGQLVRRLLWQRFRFTFNWNQPAQDLSSVVSEARHLYERHGDVIFETTGPRSFRFRKPRQRVATEGIRVSLEPVFQALTARGLWIATDRELGGLARKLVGLAHAEQRRIGRKEFTRRFGGITP